MKINLMSLLLVALTFGVVMGLLAGLLGRWVLALIAVLVCAVTVFFVVQVIRMMTWPDEDDAEEQ